VNNRVTVWLGAVAGAAAGAALAYLYLTPAGRRLRDDLEPELTRLITELQRVRDTADNAGSRRM